jgi:Arc/MetJ-type ribon-helix-helix transcriptional regulator
MNVVLRGVTKEYLDLMVEEGYANTQSEAIRMAIVYFGKEHLNKEIELVNKKLDYIDSEAKAGRRKILNSKEALGEYEKYLK